jgi:phosphate transport system permease protein
LSATITTSVIALLVALPIGTVVALYLSEFAPHTVREVLKPALELLSAVPTRRVGYFAYSSFRRSCSGSCPILPNIQYAQRGTGDGDHDHFPTSVR